ncbi:MAG: hypothetical protein RLZZ316_2942 [Bacteroidota bacterium]
MFLFGNFTHMKIVLFATLLFYNMQVFAQQPDLLKFYYKKEVVLQLKTIGNNPAPVLIIKKQWLQDGESLRLVYKCASKHPGWVRSFQWAGNENELVTEKTFNTDEGTYTLLFKDYKEALIKNGKLLLYTIQQPPQEGGPSGIRLQRFLICQLILE